MKIAKEGWPFVAGAAALVLLGGWIDGRIALVLLPLALLVVWFFRDPERRTPDVGGRLYSAADGRVLAAGPERVSVFLSLFDVHVCRAPCSGVVASIERRAGRFLAAWRDDASTRNERVELRIGEGAKAVGVTLVAGLVARQIVCRVRPGQRLAAGERIGIIRFGSRVDVDLPAGSRPSLRVGDRTVAGLTPIADLAVAAARPGASSSPASRTTTEEDGVREPAQGGRP